MAEGAQVLALRQLISPRRLRLARVATANWQRRAMFLLGGIAVGAAAVGLASAADWVQAEFHLLVTRWHYASLTVTPLGLAFSVFLTNRFFQNSQGSGFPQAIAAPRGCTSLHEPIEHGVGDGTGPKDPG